MLKQAATLLQTAPLGAPETPLNQIGGGMALSAAQRDGVFQHVAPTAQSAADQTKYAAKCQQFLQDKMKNLHYAHQEKLSGGHTWPADTLFSTSNEEEMIVFKNAPRQGRSRR